MDSNPELTIAFDGLCASIRNAADGELELIGDEFVERLLGLGFRLGRNDSTERLEEIAMHVPAQHRRDFWDGVNRG